jgi:hypothetical protein
LRICARIRALTTARSARSVFLLAVATPPPFSEALPASDLDFPIETQSETEARMRREGDDAARRAEALLRVAAEDGAARGVRASKAAKHTRC